MNIRILILCCLVAASLSVSAQLTNSFHDEFHIDSLDVINLNIEGDVEIVYQAGNVLYTNTLVELYNASSNIFKTWLREGRYDLELLETGKNGTIKHKNLNRRGVSTVKGATREEVKVVVSIPDVFEAVSESQFRRIDKTATAKSK